MTYHQEVILAMELDRRHIGKLVQMITDSWSMTGTLERVTQHDNREWEFMYSSWGVPRGLLPKSGEIYTVLKIGPWEGRVIGNQPVTVETVVGTLEAPETATRALPNLITPEESAEARAIIQGTVVDGPSNLERLAFGDVHRMDDHGPEMTRCGVTRTGYIATTWEDGDVTCPDCLAWQADAESGEYEDLPPEPPAEWHKR